MSIEAASLYKLENIGGMPNLSSFFSRNQEGWISFYMVIQNVRYVPLRWIVFHTLIYKRLIEVIGLQGKSNISSDFLVVACCLYKCNMY